MPPKGKSKAEESKYGAGWRSNKIGIAEDVVMPSGDIALVRRPGIEGLIKEGILNEVDGLTSIVSSEFLTEDTAGTKQVDGEKLMRSPEDLMKVLMVADKVIIATVVLPRVTPVPADNEDGTPAERDPEALYPDQIGLEDKMFIFNYVVGGSRDVASFREGSQAAVGVLPAGKAVPRTPGGRPRAQGRR